MIKISLPEPKKDRGGIFEDYKIFYVVKLSETRSYEGKKALKRPSELCLDLLEAVGTDTLVIEINNVVSVSAKNAGGLILFKDYLIIVGKYLNGVLDINVHYFSDLNGENYSSELVDLSYDSCRFHFNFPSDLWS